MNITVNGETRSVASGATIIGVLEQLAIGTKMVIVEQNGQVIHRDRLPKVPVNEGDRLEIIQMMGGG